MQKKCTTSLRCAVLSFNMRSSNCTPLSSLPANFSWKAAKLCSLPLTQLLSSFLSSLHWILKHDCPSYILYGVHSFTEFVVSPGAPLAIRCAFRFLSCGIPEIQLTCALFPPSSGPEMSGSFFFTNNRNISCSRRTDNIIFSYMCDCSSFSGKLCRR